MNSKKQKMAALLQSIINIVYKVLTAMLIRSSTARSPLLSLALFGAALMMPLGAAAETTSIRFQLDWRFEGPAAPFLMAAEKGYFAEEGLQVQIDSGSGSAGAVNRVASGAYEMGFGDLNALVEFLAENSEGPGIKGVYIVYDGTPAAVFARKESGIESPADLTGKTIAAPAFDTGYRAWASLPLPMGWRPTRWRGKTLTLRYAKPC